MATEGLLQMMKNAFYFNFKSFFVLNVLKFLSYFFAHVEKRLDYKGKVNSKIYDVTFWEANNFNTHIVQYLKKYMQLENKILSVNRI